MRTPFFAELWETPDSAWLITYLRDDECEDIVGGISMNADAFQADLFLQSVQMDRLKN